MALYTPNERCVNGSALPLPLAGEGGAMERPANAEDQVSAVAMNFVQ